MKILWCAGEPHEAGPRGAEAVSVRGHGEPPASGLGPLHLPGVHWPHSESSHWLKQEAAVLITDGSEDWYRGTTSEMEKLVLTVIFWFNRWLFNWPLIMPASSRLWEELYLFKWRYERKEAAGAIEGENEWLFLKKADNCGAWLEDTIYKGWTKLSFRVFSLVIQNESGFLIGQQRNWSEGRCSHA